MTHVRVTEHTGVAAGVGGGMQGDQYQDAADAEHHECPEQNALMEGKQSLRRRKTASHNLWLTFARVFGGETGGRPGKQRTAGTGGDRRTLF